VDLHHRHQNLLLLDPHQVKSLLPQETLLHQVTQVQVDQVQVDQAQVIQPQQKKLPVDPPQVNPLQVETLLLQNPPHLEKVHHQVAQALQNLLHLEIHHQVSLPQVVIPLLHQGPLSPLILHQGPHQATHHQVNPHLEIPQVEPAVAALLTKLSQLILVLHLQTHQVTNLQLATHHQAIHNLLKMIVKITLTHQAAAAMITKLPLLRTTLNGNNSK
jgi:hypothetical protein